VLYGRTFALRDNNPLKIHLYGYLKTISSAVADMAAHRCHFPLVNNNDKISHSWVKFSPLSGAFLFNALSNLWDNQNQMFPENRKLDSLGYIFFAENWVYLQTL